MPLRILSPVGDVGGSVDFIEQPTLAPGYHARACGFDMNRDGLIGNPEDCNVCDGVTTDPDLDGVNEDIFYIDGTSGNDTTGNGTAGNPYKTVAKAVSVADGPGDGAEEIFCLRGNFTAQIDLNIGGIAGSYIRDHVELPDNPMMVVGWDTDNDGQYPPYDLDDDVVLNGSGAGLSGFNPDDGEQSYIEVAHLRTVDFDDIEAGYEAFYNLWAGAGDDITHHYVHDIESANNATGNNNNSGGSLALGCDSTGFIRHIVFSNLELTEAGGTVVEIYVGNSPDHMEHVRFEHMSVDMSGPSADEVTFMWAPKVTSLEVLNNVVDSRAGSWNGSAAYGIYIADCAQDVIVRGNQLQDFSMPMALEADWGGCTARWLADVVVDGNLIRNESHFTRTNTWMWAQLYVHARHNGAAQTIGNFSITNNVLYAAPGFGADGLLSLEVGADTGSQDSVAVVVGNTMVGGHWGGFFIGKDAHPQSLNSVYFLNNIATQMEDPYPVYIDYTLSNFQADGNIYAPGGIFAWNGNETDLAGWKSATGEDSGAASCNPTFAPGATFPLAAGDTCARGRGVDVTAFTLRDVDGEARFSSVAMAGANVDGPADDAVLFEDEFDRPANPKIGHGWQQAGGDPAWGTLYQALVQEGGGGGLLVAQRSFRESSASQIRVSFGAYLEVDGSDGSDYAVSFQLGDEDSFTSDERDVGAAVNLRWGGPGGGLGTDGGLGLVLPDDNVIEIGAVDGDILFVEVIIDQADGSYAVNTNFGGGAAPFYSDVPLNAFRLVVDGASGFHLFDSVRVEEVP